MASNIANLDGYAQLAILNTYNDSKPERYIYNSEIDGVPTEKLEIDGHYPKIELIKKASNPETGYEGYLYKNLETGKYYFVHEGSATPGFNLETKQDYWDNVRATLADNKLPPQFKDAYNFLHEVRRLG